MSEGYMRDFARSPIGHHDSAVQDVRADGLASRHLGVGEGLAALIERV